MLSRSVTRGRCRKWWARCPNRRIRVIRGLRVETGLARLEEDTKAAVSGSVYMTSV